MKYVMGKASIFNGAGRLHVYDFSALLSGVLSLQRSRPDVRCRRDRAEPDGKRGNAVSECGAGDSEGVEAMHFRPQCRSQRGWDDDAGC